MIFAATPKDIRAKVRYTPSIRDEIVNCERAKSVANWTNNKETDMARMACRVQDQTSGS